MNRALPVLMLVGAAGLLGWYAFSRAPQGAKFAHDYKWKLLPTNLISKPVATEAGTTVKNYIVKSGDTLGKIADKFEISYKTLLTLNPQFQPAGSRNPDKIRIGEAIRVG